MVQSAAQDLRSWLLGLGLECYAGAFEANEMELEDLETLERLTAEDLKDDFGVKPPRHRRELLAAIAEHIERPTLGRWLAILRALSSEAPAEPKVSTDLFKWTTDTLQPAFSGKDIDSSLLVLRNQVAEQLLGKTETAMQ